MSFLPARGKGMKTMFEYDLVRCFYYREGLSKRNLVLALTELDKSPVVSNLPEKRGFLRDPVCEGGLLQRPRGGAWLPPSYS